jgi:hypothetical protein
MAWKLARSLETLRAQINIHYPKRSKASDGTIGDAAHSARKSDHNPDSQGRVCAFDITKDLKNGPDLDKLVPLLLKDPRTKYVIYDAKIYNPTIQGGKARPYRGVNAHKQHLHLSVTQAGANDLRNWILPGSPLMTAVEKPKPKYDPLRAVSFFVGRGWSEVAACALVASIMWESGGNKNWTIVWDARGDKDKKTGVYNSRYAPQWNGPRVIGFEQFAKKNQRDFLDPYIQLAYVSHELSTLEKKAGARLRVAETIEEANEAAISYWRPGIPHTNERLKIAKKLLAS